MHSKKPTPSFILSLPRPHHPHEPPPWTPVEDPPPPPFIPSNKPSIAAPGVPPAAVPPVWSCTECSASTTPVRRSGPAGPASLCNACGLRLAKKARALAGGRIAKKRTGRKAAKKSKDVKKEKGKGDVVALKNAAHGVHQYDSPRPAPAPVMKKEEQVEDKCSEDKGRIDPKLQKQESTPQVAQTSQIPGNLAMEAGIAQHAVNANMSVPSTRRSGCLSNQGSICAQDPYFPGTSANTIAELDRMMPSPSAPGHGQLSPDTEFFLERADIPSSNWDTSNEMVPSWQEASVREEKVPDNLSSTQPAAIAVSVAVQSVPVGSAPAGLGIDLTPTAGPVGDASVVTAPDDDAALEAIAGGLDAGFSRGTSLMSLDRFEADGNAASGMALNRGLQEVLAITANQDLRLQWIQQLQGQLVDSKMRGAVAEAEREVANVRESVLRVMALVRGIAGALLVEQEQ